MLSLYESITTRLRKHNYHWYKCTTNTSSTYLNNDNGKHIYINIYDTYISLCNQNNYLIKIESFNGSVIDKFVSDS